MPLIQWNDNLNTQIEQIDLQHQKLVGMINTLHDAMKQRRSKEVLGDIIDNLIQYTQEHFLVEEKLFLKHGYPEKSSHIQEHNRFIDEVVGFKQDFEAERGTLSLDIMSFLNKWLLDHIRVSDKAYAPFLLKMGVA